MAKNPNFDEARRKLDAALAALREQDAGRPDSAAERPPDGPAEDASSAAAAAEDDATVRARPPVPATEALVRLLVGAALLALEGLAARSRRWEAAAGIARGPAAPAAAEDASGAGRFRHALIGWIFEAEEQLRPRGNPIRWLRDVVAYGFATVFPVLLDLLPLPRLGGRGGAGAEPTDEDTRRWARRGLAEAEPSTRFAQAALADGVDHAILYLARRPAVQQALAGLARSPAMDDAVAHIAAGPAIERAVERIAASPALDEVLTRAARSPALEEALSYLAGTRGASQALETISRSPALAELVSTQSSSVAAEILEEVRERGVSADTLAEGLVRRLLRRRPRSALPPEARGLLVQPEHRRPPAQEL
jgi:hypothetical protein